MSRRTTPSPILWRSMSCITRRSTESKKRRMSRSMSQPPSHWSQVVSQVANGLVWGAPGSESVGARKKILLEYGFQQHQYGTLKHFVLVSGDPKGSRLMRVLWDLNSAYRWSSISITILGPCEEGAYIRVEVYCVVLGRLAVHTRGGMPPGAPMGLL